MKNGLKHIQKFFSFGLILAVLFSLGIFTGHFYQPFATASPGEPSADDMTSYEVIVAAGNNTQTFLAGDFHSIGGDLAPYNAKLDADTAASTPGLPEVDDADLIAHDGSGGYYLYGRFLTNVGGTASQKIIHVNDDGTWDSSWAPTSPNSDVSVLYVSGNYLYVGGYFTTIAGQSMSRLVRFNISTGAIDTTWAPNPANGHVQTVYVSGSDIYVGGDFTGVNSIGGTTGLTRNNLAKVNNTTGALDATWNPAPNGAVDSIDLTGSDMYVAGSFTTVGGQTRNGLAKLSTASNLADATWNPAPNFSGLQVKIEGSDIYARGYFTSIGGQSRNYMAKLNTTNGNADATWNPNPSSSSMADFAILSDGIIIGGFISSVGGQSTIKYIAKVNKTTGAIDATWDPILSAPAAGIDSDGTYLYVVGQFSRTGGVRREDMAAINNITGNYTSWYPVVTGNVNDSMVATDDLVYMSGSFTQVNGVAKSGFAVVDTVTGANDPTFDLGVVVGAHPDPEFVYGNYLYLRGTFTSIGGTSITGIARVNKTTGAIDSSWNPGLNNISDAVVAGSSVYVLQLGSIKKIDIVTGIVDGAFTKTSDGSIYELVSDGESVVAIGYYSTIGGVARSNVAKYDGETGAIDADWSPVLDEGAYWAQLVGDTVYMIGDLTEINGDSIANDYFGALNIDTGEASHWSPEIDVDNIDDISFGPDAVIINGTWLDGNNTFVHFKRFQQPELNVTSPTGSGSEAVTAANIPVTFSFAPDIPIDVSFEVTGGTATDTVDYSIGSGTVTLAAGSATANIPITIVSDSESEVDETIELTLTSASDAILGDDIVYTHTIINSEPSGSGTSSGSSSALRGTAPINQDVPSITLSEIIQATGSSNIPTIQPRPTTFTRDLQYGSNGSDVSLLQQFLNRQGYTLAQSGYGSPGNETIYFRGKTMRALQRFQQTYIDTVKTVTGKLEGATRDLINLMY